MMTINELEEKWRNIPPLTSGYLMLPGVFPLPFHIGYCVNGKKCFAVEIGNLTKEIQSSIAISAECFPVSTSSNYLMFTLNYPSLEQLFIKLCWDLIENTSVDGNSLDNLIERYNNWIKLFQKERRKLMPLSSQKGLVAELCYLNEKIEGIGCEKALNSWAGPEGSDQDFLFQDSWAEVKAVTISSDQVSISSLQQLDRSDVGTLVIYFMDRTSSVSAKTISLLEIISIINAKLNTQHLRDLFSCKLAKYGFLEEEKSYYLENRYRFGERITYQVTSSFPRLIRQTVPSEVMAAKYTISLAMINDFKVKED